MVIEADVSQLPLDEQLLASPAAASSRRSGRSSSRKAWSTPTSVLRYDGRDWRPQVRIQCRDVSFAHHKFPYRLEHGNGLAGTEGRPPANEPLDLQREPFGPHRGRDPQSGRRSDGLDCGSRSDGLPIDEKLLKALPPPAQSLVRSMDLKGTIGFEYEISREIAEGPVHQHLQLRASGCGLRYDRFPYALSNVHGELEMIDGNWWFRNLEGYNGTSRVTRRRHARATPQGDDLVLRLFAANVPLEGELRERLADGHAAGLGPAPAARDHRHHGQCPLPRPARTCWTSRSAPSRGAKPVRWNRSASPTAWRTCKASSPTAAGD